MPLVECREAVVGDHQLGDQKKEEASLFLDSGHEPEFSRSNQQSLWTANRDIR